MSAGAEIKDTLTAKVGGVPTWVYGVGAGAIVLAVLAWRKPKPKAPDPAGEGTEATTAAPPDLGDDWSLSPSPMGGGTWVAAPTSGGGGGSSEADTGDDASAITDNAQWQRFVGDFLIKAGYPVQVVVNGLGGFLDGEELSAEEGALVSLAVRQFGQPPNGAPPIRIKPATPLTPTPTPGTPAPPASGTTPQPANWSKPAHWPASNSPNGYLFVKAAGAPNQTATYVVRSNGIEWVSSYDAYKRLGGFKSDAEANAAPYIVPAAELRPVPRIGKLPPAGSDASLV